MLHGRKRPALYEAISKGRSKYVYGNSLQQTAPANDTEDHVEKTPSSLPVIKWPTKPKIFQFNSGRVELSIPYQLAIAIAMLMVLVMLIFFRLGRVGSKKAVEVAQDKPAAAAPAVVVAPVQVQKVVPKVQQPVPVVENTAVTMQKEPLVVDKRDQHIVLAQYAVAKDFEPVQKYFAENGIETVIEHRQNVYFLVTKEKFENTTKAGSDGFIMKNKIKKIGAGYKAPPGFERFTPRLFSDAYGEKVK